jgi:GntR family transcriptional regulator
MVEINPRSPLPKYHQLRGILLQLIGSELSPDLPIPSERELQERYQVSRMTVRRAIDELVAEGRLYRVSGMGTYVSSDTTDVPVQLSSFSEDMAARGKTTTQRTERLELTAAEPAEAHELGLDATAQVIALDRLRLVDGEPICYEFSRLPALLLPGFLDHWGDESLFAFLDQRYRLRPTRSEQHISAAAADLRLAPALDLDVGAPLLKIRQRAYCRNDIVEYCESYYRPDRYELTVTLNSADSTVRSVREPP